ncbi:MAG TPA: OmpH family outer membrane protein [Vicinamibacteria bacterium]|jgi:Skp family chaperone for outer membrane proteins|nr:OmpH family outer membrane protein [Vicinamibacteria bacterium]
MSKTVIAALALGAATPCLLAQEAATPAPARAEAKAPRIAVIDMARVSSESLLGKGYASQLEALKNEIDAEGTKKQSELQKMDAAVKALQDELDKQGSVLSPEAVEKKRQEIVKKTRERQAFLEDGQAELQRMRERAQQQAQALNNEFQVRMKPHIEAVAKEKGIDILLDGQVTLTVNRDYDISRDVIVKADDAEKAAKAAAGKPPAPKQAVPAPPKPSPSPAPKP